MSTACLRCTPCWIGVLDSRSCSRYAIEPPVFTVSPSHHHPRITAVPVATLVLPMPKKSKKTDTGQHDAEVRYVEVSPPSGWQTMAKTVREVDEDKVKDCKEDIDTLLVFVSRQSCFPS